MSTIFLNKNDKNIQFKIVKSSFPIIILKIDFALEHPILLHFLNENQGGTLEFLSKIENIIKFQKSKRVNYDFSKKLKVTSAFCSRNTLKRGEIG